MMGGELKIGNWKMQIENWLCGRGKMSRLASQQSPVHQERLMHQVGPVHQESSA